MALTDPKFIPTLKGKPGTVMLPAAAPVNESGLAINTAEGPTADVRVRRALSLGMDRKSVIDTVLFGYGQIGTKIPCGEAPYGWCEDKDPPLPYSQFDPEAAKKLLAEAGFGKGLDLKMQVSLPLDVQTAEVLADQWKQIGVNLKIQQIPDFNQQLDNYINVRDQTSIVTSRAGLPIGLQLVGHWHDDRRLLDVAARLEEALGFDRAAHPVHG